MLHMVPFKEALDFGWKSFKENIGLVVQIALLGIVYLVFEGYLDETLGQKKGQIEIVTFYLFLRIALFVFNQGISAGFLMLGLKLFKKEPVRLIEILQGFRIVWNYIGLMILMSLAVLGGLILFIVPGIIIGIRIQFAPLLMVDKGFGPVEAIRESWSMTNGIGWKLFCFGFLSGLLNILGLFCLIIGVVITFFVTWMAYFYLYRNLADQIEPHTESAVT